MDVRKTKIMKSKRNNMKHIEALESTGDFENFINSSLMISTFRKEKPPLVESSARSAPAENRDLEVSVLEAPYPSLVHSWRRYLPKNEINIVGGKVSNTVMSNNSFNGSIIILTKVFKMWREGYKFRSSILTVSMTKVEKLRIARNLRFCLQTMRLLFKSIKFREVGFRT